VRRVGAVAALFAGLGAWVIGGAVLADPPSVAAQTPSPPAVTVGHTQDASFLASWDGKRPFFVLAIGSDARPGVCEPVERCLADSIHLIGVNPRQGAASILGFPRDSYVNIPGVGSRKINDSLFYGGPELVVQTVEELVDVNISYYLLTSFEGFRHMVNDVGGLEVELPYSLGASANLPAMSAGPQQLDGELALALARNRKGAPNGDFSRSENQGLILLAALEQFRKDIRRDPLSMFSWVISGMTHIQTELPADELFRLALATLSIEPKRVVNRVAPGGISTAGAASIVALGSEAEAMFADIADDGLLEAAES
jgi:polyisoprenyl-teichoic acid--peptidoglycan teichoic acid transferase